MLFDKLTNKLDISDIKGLLDKGADPYLLDNFFMELLSKTSSGKTEVLARIKSLPDGVTINKFLDDFKDPKLLNKLAENAGVVDSWSIVKDGPELLRRNPENIEKLSTFMKETGMEESKLISSFGNAKDPQKWVDMKIPEADLDAAYDVMKNSPLDELTPWTKEHKAQRWANHKSGNPDADFNSWSNKYDGNIKKANAANSGVDDYYYSLGWNCSNCKEVKTSDITILTDDGLQTLSRRHDIADKSPNVKKAIEVKEYSSGKVYYSEKSIKTQVALDAELLDSKEFLSIEWVFKGCEPSKPLKDALIAAGVTIKRIP